MSWIGKLSLLFILSFFACVEIEQVENAEDLRLNGEFALPLINSSLSVSDIATGENTDGSVEIDDEGRVTLKYTGEIVQRNSFEVFPPIPGIGDYPLIDTNATLVLPFVDRFITRKIVFRDTRAVFKFNSQFNEEIKVKLTIPKMVKGGKVFEQNYTIEPNGTFVSEQASFLDWTLNSNLSNINIVYDARRANGERVKLDYAAINVDFLLFKYAEAFFGSQLFDINGDVITIGVLDNWRSGGVEFTDPKVKLIVENSFGFPTRSKVNRMVMITTDGKELPLESEFINTGIDFGYPSLENVGGVVTTDFAFDNTNSNIAELFQEKISKVSYDVDALAFPNNDSTEVGFVTDESFFKVSVQVELPLKGRVNDLELYEIYEFAEVDLDAAEEVELKAVSKNGFPMDIKLQAYFLNANESKIDSLFDAGPKLIPSGQILENNQTLPLEEQIDFITIDGPKLDNLSLAKKIGLQIRLDSPEAVQGGTWILADQKIEFRMGAIVKVNID